MRRLLTIGARTARRLIVAAVGAGVLLVGLVMLFTPGPAILIIPLGLGVLATEFLWAARLLRRVNDRIAGRNGPPVTEGRARADE